MEDTLTQLKTGQIEVEAIPFITVIENDGRYYSLNNRRLFVFKALRELNLLPSNEIHVRVKQPLEREKLKYTPDHCSLTATIMVERPTTNAIITDCGEHDAAVDDDSNNPPTKSGSKKVITPALPKEILREIPNLTKLVELGKQKKVTDIINQWVHNRTIEPSQVSFIKAEIGL